MDRRGIVAPDVEPALASLKFVDQELRFGMRVAITTLGCKVNQYDSATIEDHLRKAGCTPVSFSEEADVYIVNSCTVTDRADAESRQLARRARRQNAHARVVMTGCYAQVSPRQVASLPEVDYVVGLNRLPDIIRIVRGERQKEEAKIFVTDLLRARRVETLGAETFTGQTRAFLKIQEGCNLFCTFCIVPFSRGRSRSVPPRLVLKQLEILAERGFQEVVLTGIHLGGYGHDLDPPMDLTWLLEAIDDGRPVPRVRLSSIDPHEIGERMVRLVAQAATLCPHFHIPMQSGDDTILRRMRRRYDTIQSREVLSMIRELLPHAAMGTDVIVGFPGEGEEEFARSYHFLEQAPFTYFHVFPYSPRRGTTAAKFPNKVPKHHIEERARLIRKLGAQKKREFASRFVGSTQKVLVENNRDRQLSVLKGYSRNYLRILLDDGDDGLMNSEVDVVVEAMKGTSLWGRPRSS